MSCEAQTNVARMKSLLLVLCVALAANAMAAAVPTAEQLKTLSKLLKEHHHRYTRQVTMPPFAETTGPTTTPPTDGSETPTTTVPEPSTEASTNFSSPACRRATESIVQSCVVAHGLSFEDLSGDDTSADERSLYSQFGDIFCRDSRCQSDFLQFYEICIGSEVR